MSSEHESLATAQQETSEFRGQNTSKTPANPQSYFLQSLRAAYDTGDLPDYLDTWLNNFYGNVPNSISPIEMLRACAYSKETIFRPDDLLNMIDAYKAVPMTDEARLEEINQVKPKLDSYFFYNDDPTRDKLGFKLLRETHPNLLFINSKINELSLELSDKIQQSKIRQDQVRDALQNEGEKSKKREHEIINALTSDNPSMVSSQGFIANSVNTKDGNFVRRGYADKVLTEDDSLIITRTKKGFFNIFKRDYNTGIKLCTYTTSYGVNVPLLRITYDKSHGNYSGTITQERILMHPIPKDEITRDELHTRVRTYYVTLVNTTIHPDKNDPDASVTLAITPTSPEATAYTISEVHRNNAEKEDYLDPHNVL